MEHAVAGANDVRRELDRVVDRLMSLPLPKAAAASDDVYTAAQVVLDRTRLLTDDVPPDATVPRLGPQGLGALMAVLGADYLDAARASSDPDHGPMLDALVTLRRALP